MLKRTSFAMACAMIGAALATTSPVRADDVQIGDIVISKAWTRVTPPGAKVAGGFLTITNKGKAADRLVGGSTAISGRIEIHEMSMDGGVMKMNEVAGGLEIKPGETVELKPGGYHVMFMDLTSSPAEGKPVSGTLKFQNAGNADIAYDVAPLGAKMPGGMDHGSMDHGGMKHDDHQMNMHEGHHGQH